MFSSLGSTKITQMFRSYGSQTKRSLWLKIEQSGSRYRFWLIVHQVKQIKDNQFDPIPQHQKIYKTLNWVKVVWWFLSDLPSKLMFSTVCSKYLENMCTFSLQNNKIMQLNIYQKWFQLQMYWMTPYSCSL